MSSSLINANAVHIETGRDVLSRDGRLSIVVVGNGPVGFRFLQNLVEKQFHRECQISVFGEETYPAYDRINLTSYLNETKPDGLEYEPKSWYESHSITLHTGDPVVSIDRESRTVSSRSGRTVSYDRLVLATGSRPFIPPIPGIDLPGVYAYRTIDDIRRIRSGATMAKRAVVLGGGLLGLEAADALNRLGLSVFVVEMAPVLMPRQLDTSGATLLKSLLETPQLRILLHRKTSRISKIEEGLHVQFSHGESVVADIVVVSAGIRARDELASDCKLPVGRRGGVIVDDHLQTEDHAISAIGECAEHNGTVYGLAAPGFRMASTLAETIRGNEARFRGSDEATRLKLIGVNVVFIGDYLDPTGAVIVTYQTSQSYLKLILRDNRLAGFVGVGDIPQMDRLEIGIQQRCRVYWWHINRFESKGRLWKTDDSQHIATWPPQTVVCNCTGVTRGCLATSYERGCTTVEAIAADTKATTVCGSCLPLVQQFVGQAPAPVSFDRTSAIVVGISLTALTLIAMLIFKQPITMPTSVQVGKTVWQTAITDPFWKQVTGYSMLSAVVLSLLISVRKRTQKLKRFAYASIRLLHLGLATAALLGVVLHTGFHRGSNLNFVLFWSFIAASLTGAVAGILTGTESLLSPRFRVMRRPLTMWHIACLWPLPLLIVFHIITVYWL